MFMKAVDTGLTIGKSINNKEKNKAIREIAEAINKIADGKDGVCLGESNSYENGHEYRLYSFKEQTDFFVSHLAMKLLLEKGASFYGVNIYNDNEILLDFNERNIVLEQLKNDAGVIPWNVSPMPLGYDTNCCPSSNEFDR